MRILHLALATLLISCTADSSELIEPTLDQCEDWCGCSSADACFPTGAPDSICSEACISTCSRDRSYNQCFWDELTNRDCATDCIPRVCAIRQIPKRESAFCDQWQEVAEECREFGTEVLPESVPTGCVIFHDVLLNRVEECVRMPGCEEFSACMFEAFTEVAGYGPDR